MGALPAADCRAPACSRCRESVAERAYIRVERSGDACEIVCQHCLFTKQDERGRHHGWNFATMFGLDRPGAGKVVETESV